MKVPWWISILVKKKTVAILCQHLCAQAISIFSLPFYFRISQKKSFPKVISVNLLPVELKLNYWLRKSRQIHGPCVNTKVPKNTSPGRSSLKSASSFGCNPIPHVRQVSEFEPLEDGSVQPLVASYIGGHLNPPSPPLPWCTCSCLGRWQCTFPIFHVKKTCVWVRAPGRHECPSLYCNMGALSASWEERLTAPGQCT